MEINHNQSIILWFGRNFKLSEVSLKRKPITSIIYISFVMPMKNAKML